MEDNKPDKTFSKMLEENPKKVLISISSAVVISTCVIIAFYFIIAKYDSFSALMSKIGFIVQPFFIGLAMAFLMNPIMEAMERPLNRRLLRRAKNPEGTKKVVRVITSIIALIILLAIVTLVIVLIVPDIVNTVRDLTGSFGDKFKSLLDSFNKLTNYYFNDQITEIRESKFSEILESAFTWLIDYFELGTKSSITNIATGAFNVGRVLVNVIIGIFISVYGLVSKDLFRGQIKKIIYGRFDTDKANDLMRIGRKTNDIFYGFIIGKIIDSIIIGILCYIGCLILKMPYTVLVSVIVGVTNVVPVFGPYIGAVPTVIIIFITDPIKGITFLIFILALQQLDGNFIGPKILGESTGISVFWVIVGIIVGGGLFGFIGMLLGVPITAVIYYIVGEINEKRVAKRNLPTDTDSYIELNHVDTDSGEIVPNDISDDNDSKKSFFKSFRRNKKNNDKK